MFIPDPGSDFFPSRIPDSNCLHPGSRIRIKEFKYFLTSKKWFLSSRKYDLGCSSRIRMLTFYPSRIPDPGVKKAPDPGSGTATLSCRKIEDQDSLMLLDPNQTWTSSFYIMLIILKILFSADSTKVVNLSVHGIVKFFF